MQRGVSRVIPARTTKSRLTAVAVLIGREVEVGTQGVNRRAFGRRARYGVHHGGVIHYVQSRTGSEIGGIPWAT